MQAIEFKSQLEHGQIAVPKSFHLQEGQAVRVLILVDEKTDAMPIGDVEASKRWGQTAGAWQGGELVREPQGQYEHRLELE